MKTKFWSFNRQRDENLITNEAIEWKGVFSWKGYESKNNLESFPDIEGIYLFTFEYKDGFIIHSVGITNSTKRRLYQHEREYKKGNYTILDMNFVKEGIRQEIWHGWSYAKNHQEEFLHNKSFILDSLDLQLQSYRLFFAEVADKSKRERIEFGIVQSLYNSKDSFSNLIDGGMAIRSRNNYEIPIIIQNNCNYKIYGLPSCLEI